MAFNAKYSSAISAPLDVSQLRQKFLNSYSWSGVTQKNETALMKLAALKDAPTAEAISKSIDWADSGLFGNQMSLWFISHVTPEAAIPVLIEVLRNGGTKSRSAHSCLSSLAIRSFDYNPDAPILTAERWNRWYESEGKGTSCFQRLQRRLHDHGISLKEKDDLAGLLAAVKRFPLDERYGERPAFLRNDGVPEEILIAMSLSKHLCETFHELDISPAGFPMGSPDKSWFSLEGVGRWNKWEVYLKGKLDAQNPEQLIHNR